MQTRSSNLFPKNGSSRIPTVSIVGARGYSGLELVRLLRRHPGVKLTHCFATKDFSLQNEILDMDLSGIQCLADDQLMNNLTDITFLATPAEVSLKLVPSILEAGKKIIDLSGAFRLKKNSYTHWYNFEHTASEALEQAEYGLVPFIGPCQRKTSLISNPGCYATAITMGLLPLFKNNLIQPKTLVIDAKSGATGAGKKASENLLFSEVSEDCLPYRVGRHQHLPEIVEAIEYFSGVTIAPHFTTHLLPAKRGIIAGLYAHVVEGTTLEQVARAYTQAYQHYPLVRHGQNIAKLGSINKVVHTPAVHISYELVDSKLYVFSVIDNLQKGAASQAIENLNRMLDLPTHFSLIAENI